MASLQPTEYVLRERDLGPLLHFVSGAASKWREIGVALGFTTGALNTIAAKFENTLRGPTACFTDMLSKWLKWARPNHPSPTLGTLAKALREGTVGEERMANDLMEGFQDFAGTQSNTVPPQEEVTPALPQPHSETPLNVTVGTVSSSQPSSSTNSLISTFTAMAASFPPDPLPSSSTLTDHHSAEATATPSPATNGTSVPSVPVEVVKGKIRNFQQQFNGMKVSTREGLEQRNINVKEVVQCLTNVPTDDMPEHKKFLKEQLDSLLQAESLFKLFLLMNFYWNYLAYHLLEHLMKEFSVEKVAGKMKKYKDELQQFMRDTPLEVFRQAQKERVMDLPADFKELVVKFEWPQNVTLAVVEEFRQKYAYHYNLHECAMMLITIRHGSFIVVWGIPESIVNHLKNEVAEDILSKYAVTRLEIAGDCVYEKMPTSPGSASDGPPEGATTQHPEASSANQEYMFVNPTQDFDCPVTKGLLLDPHQTRCCGKILSAEAVDRIQKGGGACPLCMEAPLMTYLDQNVRRRVREQQVFCPHKKRGCAWVGELANVDSHEKSCPKKNATEVEEHRTEEDLVRIIEAVGISKYVGFKLNVPPSTVENVCNEHSDPRDRLFEIVKMSLKGIYLNKASWEEMMELLSNPFVDLPFLAEKIESSYGTGLIEGTSDLTEDQLPRLECSTPQPFLTGKLWQPHGLAVRGEVIFIADKGKDIGTACIMRTRVAKNYTERLAFIVLNPCGIALDNDGNIYVTDRKSKKLYKFTNELEFSMKTRRVGQRESEFAYPSGIGIIKGKVYVCDMNKVKVYDTDLNFLYSFGDRKKGESIQKQKLFGPTDIARDSRDGLYVTDDRKRAVVKFRMDEESGPQYVQDLGSDVLQQPVGLSIDFKDYIYVLDRQEKSIYVFQTTGMFVKTIAMGYIMESPQAICCVKAPFESSMLYISDATNEINVWRCDINY